MSNFKQLQDRKTSWPKPEKNAEAKKKKQPVLMRGLNVNVIALFKIE